MTAVVVGSPFEASTSAAAGCRLGPRSLADEMDRLADDDVSPVGLPQADPFGWIDAHDGTLVDPEAMVRVVARRVRETVGAGDFPIVVGGEHTVSCGALAAFEDPAGITVVQFDAHADLRSEYEDDPWSHASVMRRLLERGHPLVQIGIRSACIEEIGEVYGAGADGAAGLLVSSRLPAALLTRSGLRRRSVAPLLPRIGPRVWVTIDLDALDPSVAPGVGTPEADGLSFAELIEALETVLAGRTLVGADVVELCPPLDDGRTARLAARLVRRLAVAAA